MCAQHALQHACAVSNFTHVQFYPLDRSRWLRMALLKYFKRDDSKAVLSSPEGPLTIPSSSIQAAKKSVEPLLSEKESGSRGRYEYFTE